MAYREIVTKTLLAKAKKKFITNNSIKLDNNASTVLGSWIINHNFKGEVVNDKVYITGSYDVNIWYSYNDNKETNVIKKREDYNEVVTMKNIDSNDSSVIIKCLSGPSCINCDIEGDTIKYSISKELGIELAHDEKVKIVVEEAEDPWDEIIDDPDKEIDEQVKEDYIDENSI